MLSLTNIPKTPHQCVNSEEEAAVAVEEAAAPAADRPAEAPDRPIIKLTVNTPAPSTVADPTPCFTFTTCHQIITPPLDTTHHCISKFTTMVMAITFTMESMVTTLIPKMLPFQTLHLIMHNSLVFAFSLSSFVLLLSTNKRMDTMMNQKKFLKKLWLLKRLWRLDLMIMVEWVEVIKWAANNHKATEVKVTDSNHHTASNNNMANQHMECNQAPCNQECHNSNHNTVSSNNQCNQEDMGNNHNMVNNNNHIENHNFLNRERKSILKY